MTSSWTESYRMEQSQTPAPTFLYRWKARSAQRRSNIYTRLQMTASLTAQYSHLTGEGFNKQHLTSLLSPEGVHSLIRLPTGCLEQTMSKLVPTVHALRYLDDSQQWYELPAGARDEALQHIEHGETM